MSDSYELLERVNDRHSLIAFVEAFIAEREAAETLEREQPQALEPAILQAQPASASQ